MYEVRAYKTEERENSKVIGYATVTVDGRFVFKNINLVATDRNRYGFFLSMPSYKKRNGEYVPFFNVNSPELRYGLMAAASASLMSQGMPTYTKVTDGSNPYEAIGLDYMCLKIGTSKAVSEDINSLVVHTDNTGILSFAPAPDVSSYDIAKAYQENFGTPIIEDYQIDVVPNHLGNKVADVTCSFNNEFICDSISIVRGKKEKFISLPSYKTKDGQYKEHCFPITADFRAELYSAIRESYVNEREHFIDDVNFILDREDGEAYVSPLDYDLYKMLLDDRKREAEKTPQEEKYTKPDREVSKEEKPQAETKEASAKKKPAEEKKPEKKPETQKKPPVQAKAVRGR